MHVSSMPPSLLHHLSHLPPDLTLLGEEGGEVHLHSLHLSLLSPSLAPLLAHQAGLTMAITLPTTPSTLATLHRVVLGETVTREEEEEVREVINLLGIHTNMLKVKQKPNNKVGAESIVVPKFKVEGNIDDFDLGKIDQLSTTLNELIKQEGPTQNSIREDRENEDSENKNSCNICPTRV